MVGIFRGATPVNPSRGNVALKEVYVGSVKVWPTAPWTTWHGSWSGAGYSNPTGITAWRTNPSVNVISSATPNTTLIDWGVMTPFRILRGVFVNPSQGSALGTDRISANGTILTATRTESAQFTNTSKSPWYAGHRAICEQKDQGDSYYEGYCRVNSSGSVLASDSPGWIVSRSALGVYELQAPRGFNGTVFVIPQGTTNVFGTVYELRTANPASFRVSMVNMSNIRVDSGFCVLVTGDS